MLETQLGEHLRNGEVAYHRCQQSQLTAALVLRGIAVVQGSTGYTLSDSRMRATFHFR